MRLPLISWLLTKARRAPAAAAVEGKPALSKMGWTTPKSGMEILAQNMLKENDWVVDVNAIHRRGIQVSWKRAIAGSFPGMRVTIDGKTHPITGDEATLLAKSVRHVLARAAPETAPKSEPDRIPTPSMGEG
jgi:hypothetical protein